MMRPPLLDGTKQLDLHVRYWSHITHEACGEFLKAISLVMQQEILCSLKSPKLFKMRECQSPNCFHLQVMGQMLTKQCLDSCMKNCLKHMTGLLLIWTHVHSILCTMALVQVSKLMEVKPKSLHWTYMPF